jgi:hypothetical protein
MAIAARSRLVDKSLFLVFAVLGSGSLLVLKALDIPQLTVTMVPVVFILLYAVFTVMRWSRFRLPPDQAGDNCYYLGFVYTLVSLGLALYRFSSGSGARAEEIVQDFGIALATTLAGVTLRVVLHQAREDPADVEHAARSELGHAAARVTGHLGSLLTDVVAFRNRTQDDLKHFAFESKQVAEEYRAALSVFHEQTRELGAGIAELAARIRELGPPADLLDRKLDPVAGQLERLAAAAVTMSQAQQQRDQEAIAVTERVRAALQPMERAARTLAELPELVVAFTGALERVRGVTSLMAETQKNAGELSNALIRAAERLETACAGLGGPASADAVKTRPERRRMSLIWEWASGGLYTQTPPRMIRGRGKARENTHVGA